MPEAVIIDVVRTAGGKRNGALAGWHPVDLAAETLKALAERNSLDPELVDDVIMGCVMQAGAQALNVGRNAVLAAGWPEGVPATTIDRQCGSSQQAYHFAAQGVMAGAYDVAVAAGVEVMSLVPMGASISRNVGFPFGAAADRYSDIELLEGHPGLIGQGLSAEVIANEWGLSREDLDEFGARSQALAEQAAEQGRFDNEIVAYGEVTQDEGPREPNLEKIRSLKPLTEGGRLTAAVASQISDAAAAMLVASERAVEQHGLTPRARIHHLSVRGEDPIRMLSAPIPATRYALDKAGMTLGDIDLVEINEAFASVVLAWAKELDADLSKVNVNGGAIALGHPLGATGVRLMTTMLNELERTGGRYGLQTMCEGGGQANVTIIERL